MCNEHLSKVSVLLSMYFSREKFYWLNRYCILVFFRFMEYKILTLFPIEGNL